MELELKFELEMIELELEFEKKVIVWVIMQMMVECWTSFSEDVMARCFRGCWRRCSGLLEDLEDEGLGEVEVEMGIGGVGSIPGVAASYGFLRCEDTVEDRVLVYLELGLEILILVSGFTST
ncbi:hypothetical protein LWI29_019298 [Acer saccharum]|uniref:Uncharacterized protein n=1 Tax=Acer saccharum TaxID=4024 RepID=A0AA39VS35_ACESA|nr:hypothetical protein LWI29_019298 [Acer saccharum]